MNLHTKAACWRACKMDFKYIVIVFEAFKVRAAGVEQDLEVSAVASVVVEFCQ